MNQELSMDERSCPYERNPHIPTRRRFQERAAKWGSSKNNSFGHSTFDSINNFSNQTSCDYFTLPASPRVSIPSINFIDVPGSSRGSNKSRNMSQMVSLDVPGYLTPQKYKNLVFSGDSHPQIEEEHQKRNLYVLTSEKVNIFMMIFFFK